jgi:hypothetical protein
MQLQHAAADAQMRKKASADPVIIAGMIYADACPALFFNIILCLFP